MDYRRNYENWRAQLKGTAYEQELATYEGNDHALQEAFSQWLEFGTAGMRGLLGPGTNMINIFTVRRATQGLADYLCQNSLHRGVVIAYDSRHGSSDLAQQTALVLAANNIRVHLYDKLTSVPQLSFTIRHLQADAGVVITASHNPAAYNGYKVYGASGGQISGKQAEQIIACIERVEDPFSVASMDYDQALACGLLHLAGEQEDAAYDAAVLSNLQRCCGELKPLDTNIVYTPLHGAGLRPVCTLLQSIGVRVHTVAKQSAPDGDFPTVAAPNPEHAEVFDLGIKQAEQCGAELVLATDPDCDRLGAACRTDEGWQVLNGNQIGCLLLQYLLEQHSLQSGDFAVRSLVSSPLADSIAADFGLEMRCVMTGFKHIAAQMQLAEQDKSSRFIFGFEESHGYLYGNYAQDKDACAAAGLLVCCAADCKRKGMNLLQKLDQLYRKHGYYAESVLSFTREGSSGLRAIADCMKSLRRNVPMQLAEKTIQHVRDYHSGLSFSPKAAQQTQPLQGDRANIICYELKQGSVIIRPSGTEPKLKVYISMHHREKDTAQKLHDELKAYLCTMLEKLTAVGP